MALISHMFTALLSGLQFNNNNNNNWNNNWNTIPERSLKNFNTQQHKQQWVKLSILFYIIDKW